MKPIIDFEPLGRRGDYQEGENLLECAQRLGADLASVCGGDGTCGDCVVQVLEGKVSPVTESEREFLTDERLAQGYRLACQAVPASGCRVRVPPESLTTPQRTQVEGQELPVAPDPVARSYRVALTPPTLEDPFADASRLAKALKEQHDLSGVTFDYSLLRSLPNTLRDNEWRVKAILCEGECIAVLPENSAPLGLAADLGTTKIAAYLLDLETGRTLAARGLMNPQIAYGEDIITRMAAVEKKPEMAARFQSLVVEALNAAVSEMCRECRREAGEIVDIVVVGNTAMHHLFLGLPVRQLGQSPYVPAVTSSLDVKARELGLACATGASVHLLPIVAGYVGADHIAMLLATGMQEKDGVVLAIDIGTNTEICLNNHGEFSSLSTASGPAFEGAHIRHGMRAARGAIERFQIIDGHNRIQTIEDAPAVGLCGSGILDALAQLYLLGAVDERGRMQAGPLTRGEGAGREYVIVDSTAGRNEVTFTQKDVEQLQLAKGAIRTGIEVLLSRDGLTRDDLDEVILAGAFGTYLDVSSAIAVGLLPDIPTEKVHQVGNAAGMGAKMALISGPMREKARELAGKVRYVQLAGDPGFSRTFARSMRLG
jgi:uncharacterized 2Fe-2S/4Fe-4S cluster protein (DUF4445 family)